MHAIRETVCKHRLVINLNILAHFELSTGLCYQSIGLHKPSLELPLRDHGQKTPPHQLKTNSHMKHEYTIVTP